MEADTFLEQYALTRRFSAGVPTSIKVTPGGDAVLFLRSGPRSFVQDLFIQDTTTGQERVMLTADQILQGSEENLSVEEKARRERMRLSSRGITSFQVSRDGTKILVPLSGKLFVVQLANGTIEELAMASGFPIDPRFSPDGAHVSYVRDNEVWTFDLQQKREVQVTRGASGTITNGQAEFVAQEEMSRFEGYWWSPDSNAIAFQQTDTAGMEVMNIADAMHPDRPPQSWPYPRAGNPNAKVRLGIATLGSESTTWVDWDRKQFPYLATVKWKENAPLTILVQNREQTHQVLHAVDPANGATTPLLAERDQAWLNLDQQMPYWLPDGSGFLWVTEQGGAAQLMLHNRTGTLLRELTPRHFGFKELVIAGGNDCVAYVQGGDDPTQTHLFRLGLDNPASITKLTSASGVHSAVFAEDHSVYVQTSSTLDGDRMQTIKDSSGKDLARLKSVAEVPPFLPNLEFTRTKSDPEMHAVIVRPRDFSPRRKYPVIVSVYGGPHSQTVMTAPMMYLLQQWIADRGFIVVSIDGRGTPSRGREWERAIKGDLIELPLCDQVAGLQSLGRTYREMDMARVGIYGWSFGGYFAAMAVMQRPDVFHAGVAGAPVCDWRDYDTHYTERYMGMPDDNSQGYDASSVLTYCDRLSRPLLVIHGTADDNVYFMHSLKMSNALFRSGRAHEFLPLSDFTHMVADPLITTRLNGRIVNFFEENIKTRRPF